MDRTEKKIVNRLTEIEDLMNENEIMLNDCISFRKATENNNRIAALNKEVEELMQLRDSPVPISSRYGGIVASRKTIPRNGVDMEMLMRTGLYAWLWENHKDCFDLNLKKAEDVLGQDLSGYAKRGEYHRYIVTTDEDYKYIQSVIDDYYREKDE